MDGGSASTSDCGSAHLPVESTLNSSDRSVIQRLQFKPAHWLAGGQGPQCLAPMEQMDPEMTLR
jgi:hypothetical protein